MFRFGRNELLSFRYGFVLFFLSPQMSIYWASSMICSMWSYEIFNFDWLFFRRHRCFCWKFVFFYFKICPKAKNEDLWGNISWMLILCGTFSKLIRLNLFNFFTLALAVVLYRFFNALFNYIAKIHVSCQHLSCLTYIAYHFQNWSSERIENIQANFYE